MTTRLTKTILVITICLTTSFAFGQTSIKQAEKRELTQNNLKYDTSWTAIIKSRWPFDTTFKVSALTQNDLRVIDSIYKICVIEYNKSFTQDNKEWSIDLHKNAYRKQLVVVTNKKGDKEVWVNCFCDIRDDRWKTNIRLVSDGGNCYFNFKINLKTKKYYDFGVNGEA